MTPEPVPTNGVARPRRKVTWSQRLALATFVWLDERFRIRRGAAAISNFYMQVNFQFPRSHTEKYKIRSIWYWYPMYTMGSIALLAFIIATISGILLTLYYVPSVTPVANGRDPLSNEAWESVATIMLDVPFGFMIRAIHFWSAMIMVSAVFIHMMRVYFTQAYKKPRELNWLLGFALLAVTLILGYTGYILPWSQLAYWAATIGLEMSMASPLIGKWLAAFLFGGTSLGQATVTRQYILHVFILPVITMGLIALHILIVWLQGIAEPH